MRLKSKSIIAALLAASMLVSNVTPTFASQVNEANSKENGVAAQANEEYDAAQASPLLVTEVVTDGPSGTAYTYAEIYNNSDVPVNFADYTFYYKYPNGTGQVFDKSKWGNKGADLYIEPGKTLVLWQSTGAAGKTVKEFNEWYGTQLEENKDILRINYSGIHSTDRRGYYIGKDEDTVVTYAWSNEAGDEIPTGNADKLGIQYKYDGSRECKDIGTAKATPGSVSNEQVPSQRVHVGEKTPVIESAAAEGSSELNVTAKIPYTGTAKGMVVSLYYRQKAEGIEQSYQAYKLKSWNRVEMTSDGDDQTFKGTVSADKLFGDEVIWYVRASYGGTLTTKTQEQTTAITPVIAEGDNSAPIAITEVAPATTDGNHYTYFEIYNQTNKPVNLGYYKILYYYNYPYKTASASGKVWNLCDDFTQMLEPGQVMVCWLDNTGLTEEDFNAFYNTNLEMGKNLIKINYAGFHQTDNRWMRIGTNESNAFTLAGFNVESIQKVTSGKSVKYAVPHGNNGVNESIPAQIGTEVTPGTVEDWQIAENLIGFKGYPDYKADDGKKPTLKVCQESDFLIPESINEGDTLKVMYDTDLLMGAVGSDRLSKFTDYIDENNVSNHPGGSERLKTRPYILGTEILYKLDDDTEWTSIKEKKQWRLGHYLMQLPSDILYGHNEVTFKVRAYSLYSYNETPETTVKINRLNDTKGAVRLNVSDGSVISGVTTITANDGGDNIDTTIQVDQNAQTQKNVFENGAYFMIKTSGIDSYFKDAVTAPYGTNPRDILKIMVSWCEAPASQAIHVDNKYFTYNADTDSYDVTLTVWAGGPGTPFEETYESVLGENHEDFTVSGLQIKLADGKSYLPVEITPDNEKTNTSTALDVWHTIGDSAGMIPHMNAKFSIPAKEAEAVGITVDTTTLTDGEHVVTAVSGEKSTTAKVIVDNTVPSISTEIAEDEVIYKSILLEEGKMVSDANGVSEVIANLDGEVISLPAVIDPKELKTGAHTLTIAATDEAGNTATKVINFKTEEMNPAVTDTDNDGVGSNSANLTVKLGNEKADVTYYQGRSLTEENGGIVKTEVKESENGDIPYQLFTVNAGDVNSDDTVAIKWEGLASNADDKHPIKMYVRDIEDGNWAAVASADENGNIEANVKAGKYVKDGKAEVLVQTYTKGVKPSAAIGQNPNKVSDSTAVEMSSWDGTTRPEKYDFAMAWETDTQYYSESFPYHYDNMNQWIADNAEEWKIKYVFHTGDIVDDCDMKGEWVNADHSMKILDNAGIPYGVLAGNHDVYAGAENYGDYWKYFGEDRFAGRDYYGGSYKNNLGHYDLISQGGQDFIMLYMSWDIYENELNWMNEVLAKYPDRKAILAFHRYIGVGAGEQKLDYTGKLIQNEVVKKNKNVIAVIDGHYHGASLQTDAFDDDGDGVNERTVYQICTDYQSDAEGGSEYIKFLYFDIANGKIYVNSYSPYRDDFNYYDTAKLSSYAAGARATNQDIAELDINFDTDVKTLTTNSISADVRTNQKIGSLKDVNETATYTWSGLTAETEYSWYAKVTNAKNGVTYTNVKSFKTEKKPEVYTVSATAGIGGVISNVGETSVVENGNITYTIAPKKGYEILKVVVDGKEVELVDNQYTLSSIKSNHTIDVTFREAKQEGNNANNNDSNGVPAKGSVHKQAGVNYKVIATSSKGGMVAAAGLYNTGMTVVKIPSTIKINGLTYKVTQINSKAFSNQKNIRTVSITSKYLTKIGSSAFANCRLLKKVTISSKKLKSIGKSAFAGCKKLSTVTIKSSLLKKSRVGLNAFKGIRKNCRFKVPSKKVKSYKKILLAKGAKRVRFF